MAGTAAFPTPYRARRNARNSSPLYGLLHKLWIHGGWGVHLKNLAVLLVKEQMKVWRSSPTEMSISALEAALTARSRSY